MSSPLLERITRQISLNGPMPLAEYMHVCMADPTDGYYANREAIGRSGDFITAPEVSQMFGEMIGVWCVLAWEAMGKPKSVNLVELGPGRGTLMADLLRTTQKFTEFHSALAVHLIETSPRLRNEQQLLLCDSHSKISWHDNLNDVLDVPFLLIGNEFLDVIPIRQFVKNGKNWPERAVGLDENGKLCWMLTPASIDTKSLPAGSSDEPDGAVFEKSPAREAVVLDITSKVKSNGGVGLFIDYGHTQSGFGDTFQAMWAHEFADPLTDPGHCDLTSHVDFEALTRVAEQAGANIKPVITQGEFLLKLGLLERAAELGRGKLEELQKRLTGEAERLALPDQMGDLFKVFCLSSVATDIPPFGT